MCLLFFLADLVFFGNKCWCLREKSGFIGDYVERNGTLSPSFRKDSRDPVTPKTSPYREPGSSIIESRTGIGDSSLGAVFCVKIKL